MPYILPWVMEQQPTQAGHTLESAAQVRSHLNRSDSHCNTDADCSNHSYHSYPDLLGYDWDDIYILPFVVNALCQSCIVYSTAHKSARNCLSNFKQYPITYHWVGDFFILFFRLSFD